MLIVILFAGTSVRAVSAQVVLVDADRAWIESALAAWQTTCRDVLRQDVDPLPWLVLFDGTVAWHVNPQGDVSASPGDHVTETEVSFSGRRVAVRGFEHGGMLRLPDGNQVPPMLASFAGTYGESERPFFVMSLPAIWRADERLKKEVNLDRLVRAVFVHEMTHTRQTPFVGPRIDAIDKAHSLGDALNDDIIQTRFSSVPGFREAYERERDLLYHAAAEPDARKRRALARDALRAMRERRERFFRGGDAFYDELEDNFLSMEGLAQWAAYRVALADGLSREDALALIRRGGKYWSQDEGFAVFLVIDAGVRDWRGRVFRRDPATVEALLEAAAR